VASPHRDHRPPSSVRFQDEGDGEDEDDEDDEDDEEEDDEDEDEEGDEVDYDTESRSHDVGRLPSKATPRGPPVRELTAHLTDRLARKVGAALRVVVMGVAVLAAVERILRQTSPLIDRERSRWI
jgi:hypothetical protein